MKGDNQMILNTATMMLAVQEYLNRRWDETASGEACPQVTDVKASSNGYGGHDLAFVVSLKSEFKV